ncbi:hypothetical protein DKT77_04620 [Meridianimarinicoccus roseus]|jgi:hypothetical protein|uniref:Uncharacterized protein n=2 Tax=Meridianimarinicoccus roseus TaxID=2072018 RepID=A0A2V2LKT0_9RHOB|nr:hypothetical protein DKT77_04620 [Meridianimarinicoccus roseus]
MTGGANLNLLNDPKRAGVPCFDYIHQRNVARMANVAPFAAERAFMGAPRPAAIRSPVIAARAQHPS